MIDFSFTDKMQGFVREAKTLVRGYDRIILCLLEKCKFFRAESQEISFTTPPAAGRNTF